MKKTKSFVVLVLIVIYILGVVPRQVVFAEELPPTPSPTASPDSLLSPSPDPSPSLDPTPTPSPTPCPTGCDTTPVGTVDQSNSGTVDNNVQAGSDTGNNTIDNTGVTSLEATDSAQPESAPAAQPENDNHDNSAGTQSTSQNAISTGDANIQADVLNLANTNSANSDTQFQIQNVFGSQTGDITLVDAGSKAPEPSLLLVNQSNTATVTNYILVYANSGWNLITGGLGDIQTGAAYATVNIINFINANLANSQLSFAIINVFGTLDGNIVLPEPSQLATLLGGNAQINQTNTGTVNNSVTASSDTGGNSLENGSIETGNAITTANVINNVNSNMLGGSFYHLLVNNYGTWNGQFVGWGNLAPEAPHYGHMFFDVNNMPALDTLILNGEINQTNDATVINTVVAQSNTGNNTIDGNGKIKTGNAYTTVNLLNFVNSNWAGTRGFFGLVNILGTLNGDIGGKDHFAALVASAAPPQDPESPSHSEVHQAGGQLVSSMNTNVGTHVNPGDTSTFFITVQNTGTGTVYNGKLIFNLNAPDGNLVAAQTFEFGELKPGQKVKISFGAVLSKTAPGGAYEALAEATGKTGPQDTEVISDSSTRFLVGGPVIDVSNVTPHVKGLHDIAAPHTTIQTHEGGAYYSEIWGNVFLLLLFLTYVRMLQLLYKKRENDVVIEQTPKTN